MRLGPLGITSRAVGNPQEGTIARAIHLTQLIQIGYINEYEKLQMTCL